MTPQPDYVPFRAADSVRETENLPVPASWLADRPAEVHSVHQPSGLLFGNAGPDQGYGMKLANSFGNRLVLADGEQAQDVLAGCLAVGLRRGSLFGRAPVIYDFELAFTLWGFLGSADDELVKYRRPLFEEASHHYEAQRHISDQTPEATLRLSHTEVARRMSDWRTLLGSNG